MAGISIVAIESRKQAARRPSPPLPNPASGSCSSNSYQSSLLFLDGLFDNVIKKKVRDIVSQRTTDEKFHRKVVNALGILAIIGLLCPNPSLREDIAHRMRDGFKTFAVTDRRRIHNVVKDEVTLIKRVVRSGELNRPAAVLFNEFR